MIVAHIRDIAAGILVFIGAWFVIRPQTALGAPKVRMENLSPLAQERFQAAVARRARYEHVGVVEIRLAGALAIAVGLLTLLRVVNPALAFPIYTMCGIPVLALGFVRAQNAAPKRIAPLTPRPASIMPVWQVAFFAVLGFAPLLVPVLHGGAYLASAILSALAAQVAIACSYLVARAPAVLSGDDLPVEQFLDDRLRRLRTQQCATFGFLAVFFFLFLSKFQGHYSDDGSGLLLAVAQLASVFATITIGGAIRQPTSAELLQWFS